MTRARDSTPRRSVACWVDRCQNPGNRHVLLPWFSSSATAWSIQNVRESLESQEIAQIQSHTHIYIYIYSFIYSDYDILWRSSTRFVFGVYGNLMKSSGCWRGKPQGYELQQPKDSTASSSCLLQKTRTCTSHRNSNWLALVYLVWFGFL